MTYYMKPKFKTYKDFYYQLIFNRLSIRFLGNKFVYKTLDYMNFRPSFESWIRLFQKELSHVFSKMAFYQNISIYKEDADKVTQSRPIFSYCVLKFLEI